MSGKKRPSGNQEPRIHFELQSHAPGERERRWYGLAAKIRRRSRKRRIWLELPEKDNPRKTRMDPLYTYINCTIRTYTLCGPYNGPIDLYTRRVLLVPATRTQGEGKGSTCEARMAHGASPTTREEAAAARNKEVDVDTTMGLMVIY